ncbi:HEPN domain-containing protein [Lachnospiraceae bacterium WCA-9-b2]|uniref:HEPN domain-containing protein n=1 Tax=Sporofaciens musculi TaxID=2681861 RepID=A0A7X3MGL8_9FIRM|nr:HEPN domain-containing protein [Sporofaciens musculi]MXP76058.1 HEPN domain-containing protein [Sporofaciens musculi]
MCDVRLFRSAKLDYETAAMIWKHPYHDEMILNNAAYHLQQAVEKILKGALECVGVTVPNTHRISKLVKMVYDNGANLTLTDWIDEHSEMLSEWEAQTRYDMDFLVEKRKLDAAMEEIRIFFEVNGLQNELRKELEDGAVKEMLLNCLPEKKRECSDFELNCYYIMFKKKIKSYN